MALLTVEQRKEYFNTLGLGDYNEENIKAVQKKYMLRKGDADGIYGTNTDNLLRHLMNCHLYLDPDNFRPEEFRCGCNGRHCCGYPTFMKPVELKTVQTIRSHYGKPMTITCGVRCSAYNKEVGGIPNSEHKKGLAVDYYIKGVTDTLANRKASIGWISSLPNHHYTYGNGIFAETVNGRTTKGYVSASGMGNAMHTDCRESAPAPSPYDDHGKLICDGVGGAATVKEMQRFFGTTQDGVISGQNKAQNKYYPALIAVQYGSGGSPCVRNLQRWAGTTQDGVLGINTVKAWQAKIGVTADGIFGTNSMKTWQKYLNEHDKAVYPEQTLIDKELEACKVQAAWMKDSKYQWESNPTVAKSKYRGTCVTYVACVLQRIGILPGGHYLWHDEKGKVIGANTKMTVTYPNKTLRQLKSTLKAGDIIMDGDKYDAGAGSHIFILTGRWNGNNPIVWDNHSAQENKGAYTYTRNRSVIAIVRLK